MKITPFLLPFLFLLGSISLQATVYVSEPIEADTRWTKANSPYILTNSIVVKEGATLTIEAGAKVLFSTETQLIVEGNLRAIGTKSKKILFAGKDEYTAWNGFLFERTCSPYDEENNTGSCFDFCSFKGTGEAPAQLIRSRGCYLRVSNSNIEACHTALQSERQAKVWVEGNAFKNCNRPINVRNTSIAEIRNNSFDICNSIMIGGSTQFIGNVLKNFSSKGRHSGLIVWMLGGGVVELSKNQFSKFEDCAIKVQKMSRRTTLTLINNTFKDNGTHLKLSCKYLNKGKTLIENNSFLTYLDYLIRLFSPCDEEGEVSLQLGPNYWGKLNEESLKAAILDQNNDQKINGKILVGTLLPKAPKS